MIEFERWLDDRDQARLDAIAAYNEEDCLATLELRDWLLARRPEAEARARRRDPVPAAARGPTGGRDRRGARRDGAASRRAACDVGRGRRTRAAARVFSSTTGARLARAGGGTSAARSMTDEELVDDGEALGCLEHDGEEPVDLSLENPRARSLEWTFSFPPQQHQFDEGDGGVRPA